MANKPFFAKLEAKFNKIRGRIKPHAIKLYWIEFMNKYLHINIE
jgi:hypothetical protein